jgi:hypothetical protein
VLFPILAKGLEPADHMDRPVEFDGYLIYLYRYRSGRGDLNTPLLIGPTVKLRAAVGGDRPRVVVPPEILYIVVGFMGTVVLVVLGLSWWFRRGDRKIRDHLAQRRAANALDLPAPGPENEHDQNQPRPS